MDLASVVGDTERKRFCPQMDRRTDAGTRWNQYTPFQLRWSRRYNKMAYIGKQIAFPNAFSWFGLKFIPESPIDSGFVLDNCQAIK